jgi:hypothetical protein
MKATLPILAACTAVSCGFEYVAPPEEAVSLSCISGAAKAPTRQAVAKIITSYLDGHATLCSGALIDASHVLTAAHCVEKPGVKWRAVAFGPEASVGVSAVTWLSEHKPGTEYAGSDIGLLTLLSPKEDIVPFDVAMGPPCEGSEVAVHGYGNGDGNVSPGTSRWGYDTILSVGETGLVMANGGVTALGGDSGGPVTIGNTVYGVTSWVGDDGTNGAARVDLRVGWLMENGVEVGQR